MSAAIDSISQAQPQLFTSTGAYAQAFSLFDAAIALGTIVGPVWAGFVYHLGSWWIMSLTLAVICASGAVPVVSVLLLSLIFLFHSSQPEAMFLESPHRMRFEPFADIHASGQALYTGKTKFIK